MMPSSSETGLMWPTEALTPPQGDVMPPLGVVMPLPGALLPSLPLLGPCCRVCRCRRAS